MDKVLLISSLIIAGLFIFGMTISSGFLDLADLQSGNLLGIGDLLKLDSSTAHNQTQPNTKVNDNTPATDSSSNSGIGSDISSSQTSDSSDSGSTSYSSGINQYGQYYYTTQTTSSDGRTIHVHTEYSPPTRPLGVQPTPMH